MVESDSAWIGFVGERLVLDRKQDLEGVGDRKMIGGLPVVRPVGPEL